MVSKKYMQNKLPFLLNYVVATVKAAYFSSATDDYYRNTKTEAALSWLVVFAAMAYIAWLFCYYGACPLWQRDTIFSRYYLSAFFIVFIYAAPKFVMFFGLVWLLARLFGQTERFCAFMAANNWFYLPFALSYGLSALLATSQYGPSISPVTFWYAKTFYLCLVVNFLAHYVLRLSQEIAWIVPVCFLAAHSLIRFLFDKHGMMFVF